MTRVMRAADPPLRVLGLRVQQPLGRYSAASRRGTTSRASTANRGASDPEAQDRGWRDREAIPRKFSSQHWRRGDSSAGWSSRIRRRSDAGFVLQRRCGRPLPAPPHRRPSRALYRLRLTPPAHRRRRAVLLAYCRVSPEVSMSASRGCLNSARAGCPRWCSARAPLSPRGAPAPCPFAKRPALTPTFRLVFSPA